MKMFHMHICLISRVKFHGIENKYCCIHRLIGLVGRVFTNDPGDLVSIPDRVIPKTLEFVLDTSLLNTQQYKVRINGKVEQF